MRNRNDKGFTLVETVMAAGVVSVVLIAITTLIVLAMKTNSAAGDQTTCVALAQERMEKLQQTNWDDLAGGGSLVTPTTNYCEYVDTDSNSRPDFLVAWAVSSAPSVSSNLTVTNVHVKTLDVKCTSLRGKNGQPGNPKQVTLNTFRSKGAI